MNDRANVSKIWVIVSPETLYPSNTRWFIPLSPVGGTFRSVTDAVSARKPISPSVLPFR